MRFTRLQAHCVRNLNTVSLTPHPQFNLIVGNNGSGKTSLLESIHLLALGRSFRSRQSLNIVHFQAQQLTCFAEIEPHLGQRITLGIEKEKSGVLKCKVQGEMCTRLSEFASIVPVQLITPESFRLLSAGAEERRRFLDWGVFHVEHSFAALCSSYQRALKQRNAALKSSWKQGEEGIKLWEPELVRAGEKIAMQREAYWASLLPFIQASCDAWLPEIRLEWRYLPGWKQENLTEALSAVRPKDQRWGFTSVGPHRAEIAISVDGHPASHVLSRGQQKLLVCALYFAQAQQLQHEQRKASVFLIDDLASELDSHNRAKVLASLRELGYQVFFTAIEPSQWSTAWQSGEYQMFHVEHGSVHRVASCGMPEECST